MSREQTESDADSADSYLRTEMLERIAHELRGPAGVTLGALDEIERALNNPDGVDAQALLVMARRGARRILRTADRLTRTAQLESGAIHLAQVSFDIRDLVARSVREAEQLEARSAIKIEVVAPEGPCTARVDVGWLGSALAELVSQAIRAARRKVTIEIADDGDWLCVVVTDDRSTWVEPPQTRFTPHRDRRDCALGWPLVRDVAQAHGGQLSLETVPSLEGGPAAGAKAVMRLRAG